MAKGPTNVTVPRSISSAALSLSHSFFLYETQIALWLATSALYRDIKQFDKAQSSVKEAHTLADALIKAEARVTGGTSRLFSEPDSKRGSLLSVGSVQPNGHRPNSIPNGMSKLDKSGNGWTPADAPIKRLLADIAFEVPCFKIENDDPVRSIQSYFNQETY